MPRPYTVRLAAVTDAEAYARCHVEALAHTYAHIMPPEFAAARRRELPDRITDLTTELTAMEAALAGGEEPYRTHYVAVDGDGRIVGLAASGAGMADWERALGKPPPPVGYNVDHLYTLPQTHGSGVGQALLDACLPDFHEAYLWVLNDNPRAEAFYRRNGFVDAGQHSLCGESWFHRPQYRMYRTREMGRASRQAARLLNR